MPSNAAVPTARARSVRREAYDSRSLTPPRPPPPPPIVSQLRAGAPPSVPKGRRQGRQRGAELARVQQRRLGGGHRARPAEHRHGTPHVPVRDRGHRPGGGRRRRRGLLRHIGGPDAGPDEVGGQPPRTEPDASLTGGGRPRRPRGARLLFDAVIAGEHPVVCAEERENG